jgi:hypothetical protein
MKAIGTYVRIVLLAGIAALLTIVFAPSAAAIVLRVLAFLLGGVALVALIHVLRAVAPSRRSEFEVGAARAHAPARPEELVRLEQQTALAATTAFDAYHRLRPVLREAAAHRLASRHGVELDRDVAAARALLGDEAWSVLRPDLPAPRRAFGPGFAIPRLRSVLDAIERI